MEFAELDNKTQQLVFKLQQDEIDGYYVYKRLAKTVKDEKNAEILNKIANEELNHYQYWEKKTKTELKPRRIANWFYFLLAKIFGLTFGIRLLERNEVGGAQLYQQLKEVFPDVLEFKKDEERHENQLIGMINEDFLNYVGSIVLGLSDALVELTGALAGFTFALQSTGLITIAGFITGISAAFSMGASEYLSVSEEGKSNPLKASLYTGGAYLVTVLLLITPYVILGTVDPIIPLIMSVINAVIVIFIFTFYISVAKNLSFKQRFIKITSISLGVAFVSLLIGLSVRTVFKIDI